MFNKKNGKDPADQYNKVTVNLFDDVPSDELEQDSSLENEKPSKEKKKIAFPFGKKDKKTKENQTGSENEQNNENGGSDTAALISTEDEEMIHYLDNGGKKKWSKKKLAIVIGVVLAVLAAVVFLLVKNIGGEDDSKVYVESVGEITGLGSASGVTNRYSGEVEAQDTWSITLDNGMSVEKCYVAVGDEIKTGDKLFTYNTEELALNKEKKELEIDSLNTEMTQLQKDVESYQKDLSGATTKEKIELQTQILTAQTTIKKDEYSIKAAKEELETIKKNIEDATVTSKMDGVVKSINEALGNGSDDDSTDDASTDSGTDSNTYMQILAVGDYRVKGTINETNIWEINEGDGVIVRSRVDDDTTWHGSISKIKTDGTAGSGDSSDSSSDMDYFDDSSSGGESSSSYNFYVELEDSTGLMMGQHVLIELDYGQDEEHTSLMIPGAYVRVDDEKYYVWKANKKNKLELQEIEIASYNEEIDSYEVTSGLELDDYIACDEDYLHEGMTVTKNDPIDSTEEDGSYLDESGDSYDDSYDDESGDEYVDESIDESSDSYDSGSDEIDSSFEDSYSDSDNSSVGFGKNSDSDSDSDLNSGNEFDDEEDMSDSDVYYYDEED